MLPTRRGWLRRPQPRPTAGMRLLCLPHAGGSPVLYQPWQELLPAGIELVTACPPGRLDRLDDPWPADLTALAADLAEELVPLLDRPWAVFGHSMGALVGYELVELLGRAGERLPDRLFVSAREAPDEAPVRPLHELPDEELITELVELGATDRELLAVPEIRELVLPAIRGDYRLLAGYRHRPGAILGCPITALAGDRDAGLSPAGLRRWAQWTTAGFDLVGFAGGHFYLSDSPERVMSVVLDRFGPGRT